MSATVDGGAEVGDSGRSNKYYKSCGGWRDWREVEVAIDGVLKEKRVRVMSWNPSYNVFFKGNFVNKFFKI